MKIKLPITVLLLSVLIFLSRQSLSVVWTEITDEELNLTSIPEDSDAEAVILFDEGTITPHYLIQYRRVKVLTEKGIRFAEITIPLARGEKLEELEGRTVGKDGKKTELSRGDVLKREIPGGEEIVFTLPGVQVGSVFEYFYHKRKDFPYILGPWYFQNEIFTLSSKVFLHPFGDAYSYYFVNPGDADTKPISSESRGVRWGLERIQRKADEWYRWALDSIPPVEEEPYMASVDGYRTAVYFEHVGYRGGDSEKANLIDTWSEFGEDIENWYKELSQGEDKVREKAKELIESASTDSAKAKAIYDYVHRTVEWDGQTGIFNLRKKFFKDILEREAGQRQKRVSCWFTS